MYNTQLRYRRFDQLLDDVSVDFKNMAMQNQIEPQQLIKVAKRVNKDLGLKINMTKEIILEVENYRVKLPDDFFVLNFALTCDTHSRTQTFPQGTHIEERLVAPTYKETTSQIDLCTPITVNCQKCNCTPCGCSSASCLTPGTSCSDPCATPTCDTAYNPLVPFGNYCTKPRTFMNCKGDCYELIQIINPGLTYTWSSLHPVKILKDPQTISCDCPNLYINCENVLSIKDGYIKTNFKHAKLYINYQGMMEDDDGNLMVLDHDIINDYYEYSLKSRILENLMMNDNKVENKIQLIELRLKSARIAAISIVNTPNFAEMQQVFDLNRKVMYHKYYSMFSSYGWGI